MDDKERVELFNNNVSICCCYLKRENGLLTKEFPEMKITAKRTPICPRAPIPCSEWVIFHKTGRKDVNWYIISIL